MPVARRTGSQPTTSRMSASSPPRRHHFPPPVESTPKPPKRFVVEPIETSSRSSRKKDEIKTMDGTAQPEPAPRRRLLPQPVETSMKSHRVQPVKVAPELTPEPSPRTPPPTVEANAKPKSRRKFTPQLIETSHRSKKVGDTRPATLPIDKTDITPGTNHIYLPRRKAKQQQRQPEPATPYSSTKSLVDEIQPQPPRRQGSMKPHLNTRSSTRQSSYQPELDSINSEDNLDSTHDYDYGTDGTPSLSASFGSSEDSILRLQQARTRESCDDRFSGYLFSLAAKTAEKQLQDQALAAFPNSDFHHPVEHFYHGDEPGSDDEDDFVGVGLLSDEETEALRKPTEIGWAAREMQQHQETLSRMREEETHKRIADEATLPSFRDAFWTNGITNRILNAETKKEADLMRIAASPPMLGGDLLFRMCPSPKATKFETDQRAEVKLNRDEDGGGLWGGYCVAEEASQYLSPADRGPAMLQTPFNELAEPMQNMTIDDISGKRSRPGSSSAKGLHLLTGIDERLKAEAEKAKRVEAALEEFDDTFVTQVYNYLSLGYPSLARDYDEELSKISLVPKEDLAQDDKIKGGSGHIGLAASGVTASGPEKKGARWNALKIYIQEWARLHPSMSDDTVHHHTAWGVRARRGSWAI